MTTAEEADREIYWAGRQWCVTDYGIETINPNGYQIGASALCDLTTGGGPVTAERFRPVSEKTWVDIEDFAAAFAIATEVHKGKFPPLPADAFLNALEIARQHHWESDRWPRAASASLDGSGVYTMSQIAKVDEDVRQMVEEHLNNGGQFRTLPEPSLLEPQ